MRQRAFTLGAACGACLALALALPAAAADDLPLDSARQLLTQFCFECHQGEKAEGDVRLDQALQADDYFYNGRRWIRARQLIESGEMPPATARQPTNVERQRLADNLTRILKSADCEKFKNPGRPTLRRLNKLEYRNTVRDLLGVDFQPTAGFPDDDAGDGFDNSGDALFLPPLLLEKYLDAASSLVASILETPAAKDRLFSVKPGPDRTEAVAARDNLERFMRRAFRRQITAAEAERYFTLYEKAAARGDAYEPALGLAFKAVLTSPHFLFKVEQDRPAAGTQPFRLSDFELATRLSYFLWSTMPDDDLFRLAGQNKLHEPDVLRAEVRRMLADSRSRALALSFAGQWLSLRDVLTASVEKEIPFPGAVRRAMFEEGVLLFDSLVRDDASVLRLLDARYTFLDEPLARHYGLSEAYAQAERENRPPVGPLNMRRVDLPDGSRGGILTLGAVLVSTSHSYRTSPTKRGKWILDTVLGLPPPPPPPNSAVLPTDEKSRSLNMRQKLTAHSRNPACAACHARIDPLGFALEAYDHAGRLRTTPIDTKAQLPDGTAINGAGELRRALLKQQDRFLRQFSEKMYIYALGRPLIFADECALDGIGREMAEHDQKISALITGIVTSNAFQYRKNP